MSDSPNKKPPVRRKKKKRRRLRRPIRITLAVLAVVCCFFVFKGIFSLFSSGSGTPDQDVLTPPVSTDDPEKKPDETGKESTDDLQKTLGYKIYPNTGETVATLLIDPGHGGFDGGNLVETDDPQNPILEKDINLKASKLLKEILGEINPQIKVEMTRTTDETDWDNSDGDEIKDLDNRIDLIKKYNADYFISLHCNTFAGGNDVYGYDMYIRPDDPASKAIAQTIATDLDKVDWSQFRSITDTDSYPLHVVELATAPSILFEMGFMSNAEELKALQDEKTLREIMTCVAASYSEYIMAHPDGPETSPEEKKEEEGENKDEATALVLPAADQLRKAMQSQIL